MASTGFRQEDVALVREGYRLSFRTKPPLSGRPIEFPRPGDPRRVAVLDKEVASMIQKEVIVEVKDGSPGFY